MTVLFDLLMQSYQAITLALAPFGVDKQWALLFICLFELIMLLLLASAIEEIIGRRKRGRASSGKGRKDL